MTVIRDVLAGAGASIIYFTPLFERKENNASLWQRHYKSRKQPPLILTLSKKKFERFGDSKTDAEKSSDVAEKKLEKLTQLRSLSHELTKDWKNGIGLIKKRRRDELLSRRKNIEDAKVRLMKHLSTENAVEHAEIVKEARKLILYKKPQSRMINRALLESECYRELQAQTEFKKEIEALEQNEDEQYVAELKRKKEIQLNQERKESEERSRRKQIYGFELKQQIENSNLRFQRDELQEKNADKIDLENMIKELQLIENCEADQMRRRKEVTKQNFIEAMDEKKRVAAAMKHNEEMENRVIEAYAKAKDHLNQITKRKWKQSQADKLRRSELMAEKCASIWNSDETEADERLQQQREHFEKIALEKLHAKHMMQKKLRDDLLNYQMELAAMKKKHEEEEKNIKAWQTLQRIRRNEYDKEMKSTVLQRVWKNKMELANELRKQMAEQADVRKRELIMDDDSAFIKAAIQRTNEKVIQYGEEILEESKGVRPLFPIIKAIKTFKKDNGLIQPPEYGEIDSPRRDEIRRRTEAKNSPTKDPFHFG